MPPESAGGPAQTSDEKLLRAIEESAVMFCWISADPDTRFVAWMENSERGRAVAIGEAEKDFGLEPQKDEDLERAQSLGRLEWIAEPCSGR